MLFTCMRFSVLFAMLFMPFALFADVPNEIVYQGKLKEYGQLVNGTRNIQFKIFDAQSGGSQIGAAYGGDIAVSGGLFSYTLNVSGVDWTQANYWIETIVDSKILSPREKLTAGAFALHARTAEDIRKKSGTTIEFYIGTDKKAGIANDGTMSCLSGGTTYYMVPRGAIIMWSGTIAGIPSGWVLCDGSNGTPDLRDRFILSVSGSGENPGATGGAHSITLATAQLPSHSHSANCSTDGSHAHTARMAYGGGTGSYSVHNSAASADFSNWLTGVSIDASGAHSHTISLGNTGTGNAIDIHPAYYKLAFIMRQ